MRLVLPLVLVFVLASLGHAFAVRPLVTQGLVMISVVGTNDLHGAVSPRKGKGGLSLFGGFIANLRRARAADGGAVLLVDAGDMFQGTLESNLNEGAAVIRAYNALGYDAAAIGNHEFDYGPVGDSPVPRSPTDDPFGALKARAVEAQFPFLAANLLDAATRKPVAWPNVRPAAMVAKAGVKIGIVGVTTETTLRTTMAANVRTLALAPLGDTISAAASALRREGAKVVVVAAHAGGRCRQLGDSENVESCDPGEEIMGVARTLPAGAVDLILAGHRHEGMAHRVNGIPVVEAWSNGRAFSRVDLLFDRGAGRLVSARIQPPHDVAPGRYEGAPVVADAEVERILAPDIALASRRKQERLGVVLEDVFPRSFDRESAEGNLLADLMLAARPHAKVAVTNGGGLRADLPAGELTYGALYEAQPFDNAFALVEMTGRQLAQFLADSLTHSSGILSVAGVKATARCEKGTLVVKTRFADEERLLVATNDFLASGQLGRVPGVRVTIEDGAVLRDELARALRQRGGRLRVQDFYDPKRPRLAFDGRRPLSCDR